jgi:magnesium-protoporphyrin O-methyltransferase
MEAADARRPDFSEQVACIVETAEREARRAREEAERRGHVAQVRFIHADFVDLAPALDPADVVALDRVICCYPDMEQLVAHSADKARRLLGAVYPRETVWMQLARVAINVVSRVQRSGFRFYMHPPAGVDRVLRARGLERRSLRRTVGWEVAVYSRSRGAAAE